MIATFLLFWLPGFPATKNEKPKHTFVSFGMSGLTILKPVIYSLEIKWRAMQSTTGYWPFFHVPVEKWNVIRVYVTKQC